MKWDDSKKRMLAYGCFLYAGAAISGTYAVWLFASSMSTDTQTLLVVLLGPPVAFGSILAGLVAIIATALTRGDRVLVLLCALALFLPLAYWHLESFSLGARRNEPAG